MYSRSSLYTLQSQLDRLGRYITTIILTLSPLFPVAYTSDEVIYIWSNPDGAVSYEGKLQLSQFDIKETSFRGLNFSRGGTGEEEKLVKYCKKFTVCICIVFLIAKDYT